jgi:hypothetical protein
VPVALHHPFQVHRSLLVTEHQLGLRCWEFFTQSPQPFQRQPASTTCSPPAVEFPLGKIAFKSGDRRLLLQAAPKILIHKDFMALVNSAGEFKPAKPYGRGSSLMRCVRCTLLTL